MGSFPVASPDIAKRAEFVRSQLENLRINSPGNKRNFYSCKIKPIKRGHYYAALLIAIVQVKAYIFGERVSALLVDVQHYLLFLIAIMGMWMVLEKWSQREKGKRWWYS
ncbi:hypothetical protein KQX54_010106 [Cotesia glomerata]|uniref:Uncharacterized protein n=1 Tax=Cotesia glomerata TaxID=32391 RepID=A0AAV7J3J8_COTGL|nr:hypothetical protein KQX54_010106 [Cotesia glomerata]